MSKYFDKYAIAFVLLSMLILSACFTADPCPSGFTLNATGDCVKSGENPVDGDQVLNPCPDGWVLNADGFCTQLDSTDGDNDNALPDGDLPAGDEDNADTEDPLVDGDQQITYRECSSDSECQTNEKCHFTTRPKGICFDKCSTSASCRLVESDSYCNNEQRCILGSVPDTCDEDLACEYLTICHPSVNDGNGACYLECRQDSDCTPLFADEKSGLTKTGDSDLGELDTEQEELKGFYCSGAYTCEPGSPISQGCDGNADCQNGKVCHTELDLGNGLCLEACEFTTFCYNYDNTFVCNTEGYCIAPREYCQADFDCEKGNVCHTSIQLCMSPCTGDSNCAAFSGLWCNSIGLCDYSQSGLRCSEDKDCHYGDVCHPDADDNGVCSPYCTDTEDCLATIGDNLFCNTFNRCYPGTIVDGDDDDDTDIEIVEDPCETDEICALEHRECINNQGAATCGDCLTGYHDDEGECVAGEVCLQITENSVLLVDIETATFRAIAKKNGSVFIDPYAKSDIYLRDNMSGNMFKIYSDFGDGGALPAVEIIKGSYNVWAENRLGQRVEVLKDIDIDGDVVLDVEFPFIKITANLKKNGSDFPLLDENRRGELKIYDKKTRRTNIIGETGGASSGYAIDVFEGKYNIIFNGYLNNDENSYQIYTLITNDEVTEDNHYNLNLDTITVSGTIDIGGTPEEDPEDAFGEAWLINVAKGDRFFFWSIDSLDALAYSREIVADSYFVCYQPPGGDGSSYLWQPSASEYHEWYADITGENIDFSLSHFTGVFTHNGGDLWELYDASELKYLNRGDVFLKDSVTGEKFLLANLGEQGEVNFDIWVGKATYSLYFDGHLISDDFFYQSSYPPSLHRLIWQIGLDLTDDFSTAIDIPVEEISGDVTVTYAGVEVTDFSNAQSDYVTMRRSGTSSDIPIFRFSKLSGGSYSTLLFPGTYDLKYYGSKVLNVFQNNYIEQSVSIPPAGNVLDIAISTKTLGITITVANQTKTLYDLLEDGTLSGADIRISNEITRLQAASAVDEFGRFEVIRPPGEITIYLYLYKGDSYQIYPLVDGYDFTDDDELDFNLDLLTFAIRVLKNGETMPDTSSNYSRGNLFFKSADDWRIDVRYDIGKTGDAYGVHTILPGKYNLNFSVGYGQAFPFLQWKYINCVEVY